MRRMRARFWLPFLVAFAVLLHGFLWTSDAHAAEDETTGPVDRFDLRAARVESPMGAVLYRLDRETGEVCAFSFALQSSGEARGCLGRALGGQADRYALDAVAGARGTSQSSAYRLDRVTGEICRFRLKGPSADSLEASGCIGGP